MSINVLMDRYAVINVCDLTDFSNIDPVYTVVQVLAPGICLCVCDQRISVEKLPNSLESHLPVDDHPFFQILLTGLAKLVMNI